MLEVCQVSIASKSLRYMPDSAGSKKYHFRVITMIYHRFMATRSEDGITRLCLGDPRPAI
jgi:hypothetical protein